MDIKLTESLKEDESYQEAKDIILEFNNSLDQAVDEFIKLVFAIL